MKAFFISSLLFIISQNAIAVLIDFEDTIDNGWYQQSIQTGDYRFDKNNGWMGTNNYSSWLPTGANNNTQDIEMGYGEFILSRQDGASFDLLSLDAGLSWYNYDVTDTLTVTGYDNSGNIAATANLTLLHEYQNYELNGFLNLDYVVFDGNAIGTGYVALDNLSVNPFQSTPNNVPPTLSQVVNPVPEPMMLPLFALGLLGLFKFTRLSPRRLSGSTV